MALILLQNNPPAVGGNDGVSARSDRHPVGRSHVCSARPRQYALKKYRSFKIHSPDATREHEEIWLFPSNPGLLPHPSGKR